MSWLYPTDGTHVSNPLTSNLDANGFNIDNCVELDLAGSTGALAGVKTINGSAYPPSTVLPTTRSQEFLFPTGITLFGDGGSTALMTIYDTVGGVNLQLLPLLVNSVYNMVSLNIPVNVVFPASDPGMLQFQLSIQNNTAPVLESRTFLVAPNKYIVSPFGMDLDGKHNNLLLSFTLLKGIHYDVGVPLKIVLVGTGSYNFTYSFNSNARHPDEALPTVCNAVGFA